jgi:hypothetical protein
MKQECYNNLVSCVKYLTFNYIHTVNFFYYEIVVDTYPEANCYASIALDYINLVVLHN